VKISAGSVYVGNWIWIEEPLENLQIKNV